MPERPRAPLVFGGGLDRASGIMAVEPSQWQDLRNLILYDGKAEVRKGLTAIAALGGVGGWGEDWGNDWGGPSAVDEVLNALPLRSKQIGVAVGWRRDTREVQIFKTATSGREAELVSTWFTSEGAIGIPRVLMVETTGRMFFAHEQVLLKPGIPYLRGPTFWFDPDDGTTPKALTADLDRSGGTPETIRFRGVERYLAYLVGWGYGTGSDEDRPEIVRVSLPGDPLSFRPEHYFLAGQRDDPVVRCIPGPQSLIVFKEAETYEIFGYDRATFGIRGPIDSIYGCVAPRLAIVVGGVCYFWSFQGPRRTVGGGASEDLAVPLDLDAPEPADLVEAGEVVNGFAVYDPRVRVVAWLFPTEAFEQTRVYALSLRNPQQLKWSYWELSQRIRCGAVFYPVAPTPPPGFPDIDLVDPSSTAVEITWTNVNALGDEITEFWIRNVTLSGAWAKVAERAYTGVQMIHTQHGLDAETDYDVALRHRRGDLYNAGAEDSTDPSTWPAASRASFTTDAPPATPGREFDNAFTDTFFSGGIEYTRHKLQWTPPADIERGWALYENSVNNFGTASVVASGSSHDPEDAGSNLMNPVFPCAIGTACVTHEISKPSTTPGNFFYWIVDTNGGDSPETALASNPLTY